MGKENKPMNIFSLKYYLYSILKTVMSIFVPSVAFLTVAYLYSIGFIEPILAVVLAGSVLGLYLVYKIYTSKSANFKGLLSYCSAISFRHFQLL